MKHRKILANNIARIGLTSSEKLVFGGKKCTFVEKKVIKYSFE